MENLILVGKKKKCWKPSTPSRTRAVTVPAYLMILHPELKDASFDVFYSEKTHELIYRPYDEKNEHREIL